MNPVSVRAYVALGSNLDDPADQLDRAFTALADMPGSELVARSPVYRSSPLGPQEQPDFLNAVAALDTTLSPEALLDALQAIEHRHHRRRGERWGPRTLDLDLLIYGAQSIDTPRLRVPHPELRHRMFVLQPLVDLAPELEVPGLGTASRLLKDKDPGGRGRLERYR